jgi:hypothetical protein
MKQDNSILAALDEGQQDDLLIDWSVPQPDASQDGRRFSIDAPRTWRRRAAAGSRRWFGPWRLSSPDDWHMRHEEYAAMLSFKETTPMRAIDAVIRAVRRGARHARESRDCV